MSQTMTIGAAAKAAGLSVDAVRFYERSGVIRGAARANGRRVYGASDIEELLVIARLRATDMSLPEIARYLRLVRAGEATVPERSVILAAHRERVAAQIAELTATLFVLDFKLEHAYEIARGEIEIPGAPRFFEAAPPRRMPSRDKLRIVGGGSAR